MLAAVGAQTDRTTVQTTFDRAVDETMREIEPEMQARVREKGADHDRVTSNMVWARFDHHVTQPVEGLPDPHLHARAHGYVFNLTRDGDKWNAGQFGDLKADGPYWEAVFEARVATELQKTGYGILPTARGWEVSGILGTVTLEYVHEFLDKRAKGLSERPGDALDGNSCARRRMMAAA